MADVNLDAVPDLAGNVDAIFEKGREAYTAGDYQKALPHIQKAADMGHRLAQYILGDFYRMGTGVPHDTTKALELYRLAAAGGNARAQYTLGLYYHKQLAGMEIAKVDAATAADWFEKAAEQGIADAQYRISCMYLYGGEIKKDVHKGLHWLEKAASGGSKPAQDLLDKLEDYVDNNGDASVIPIFMTNGTDKSAELHAQAVAAYNAGDYSAASALWLQAAEMGNVESQKSIGTMYHQGVGVPHDVAKAIEWYRKAAAQEDAETQYLLACLYSNGKDVPEDKAETVKWLKQAAANCNADAQFELGELCRIGDAVPKNTEIALELYRLAAEQGHKGAQCNLGLYYSNNLLGVDNDKPDISPALMWLRRAAAQGSAFAQYALGDLYRHGNGVPKDPKQAVELYRQSAEQGYVEAQFLLGLYYTDQLNDIDNENIDLDKAAEWFKKAAEQGHAISQYELGRFYRYGGGGMPKDTDKAVYLYHQSAAQGYDEAQYILGLYYCNDLYEMDTANEDYAQAAELFRKAAEQGNAAAMHKLGLLYAVGKGVEEDQTKAIEWIMKAAEAGDEDAIKLIEEIQEEGEQDE